MTIGLVLIGAYVLGAVVWAVGSVIWEDYGDAIRARWPKWIVVLFPLFFSVYVAVLKAVTMRQLRRDAEEYDAAHPPVHHGRATVWPRPGTAATERASVPTRQVIDGEWRERR